MKRNNKKNNFFVKFMIVFGFLAPAPLIAFFSITGYVYCLLICAVFCIIQVSQRGIRKKKSADRVFLLYAFVVLTSYIVCSIRMPDTWKNGLLSSLIQFLLLIIIYYYFEGRNNEAKMAYVRGVYYSAFFQMIWAYAQYILFNFFGIDINAIIFDGFLHTAQESASQISYYGIKLSGLCWNSANLAPLMIFGFLYTKKRITKIFFAIISFISGNRTLMAGMTLCILLSFAIPMIKYHKIKMKTILWMLGMVAVAIIGIITFWNTFIIAVEKVIWLFDVATNASTEPSTFVHVRYLITVPEVTAKNDFITNIIGCGPGASGYIFVKYFNQFADGDAWVIECDYINILWSYGYIGFVIYYFWLLRNMKKSARGKVEYSIFYISLLFMGIMYNITFNWVTFLLLMLFSLDREGISIFRIADRTICSLNSKISEKAYLDNDT